jgi:hypothetical protein
MARGFCVFGLEVDSFEVGDGRKEVDNGSLCFCDRSVVDVAVLRVEAYADGGRVDEG